MDGRHRDSVPTLSDDRLSTDFCSTGDGLPPRQNGPWQGVMGPRDTGPSAAGASESVGFASPVPRIPEPLEADAECPASQSPQLPYPTDALTEHRIKAVARIGSRRREVMRFSNYGGGFVRGILLAPDPRSNAVCRPRSRLTPTRSVNEDRNGTSPSSLTQRTPTPPPRSAQPHSR